MIIQPLPYYNGMLPINGTDNDNPGRGKRLQIPAMICLFGGGIEERTNGLRKNALSAAYCNAMPGKGKSRKQFKVS